MRDPQHSFLQSVAALLLIALAAVSVGGCANGLPVNGRADGNKTAKYVVPAKKVSFIAPEFILFENSARITCFWVQINDNPKSYYAVFRNGTFDRVVVAPPHPSVLERQNDGSRFVRTTREDPEAHLRRVFAAPRVAPASIGRDLRYEHGREPWNILPAFIILAPFLIPDAVAGPISSSTRTRKLMKAQEIQPGDSMGAVEQILGQPFQISDRRNRVVDLHFGPAKAIALDAGLTSKKTLVRMKGGRVYGVFFDDFYIDPK
jgi:hypothetical protein